MAFDGSDGKRPFVVVSREELNRGDYFLAVPFTSEKLALRRTLPNYVYFPAKAHGLPKGCVAQAEALTLLRKTDLALPVDRLGRLNAKAMAKVIRAIGYVLESDCKPTTPVA